MSLCIVCTTVARAADNLEVFCCSSSPRRFSSQVTSDLQSRSMINFYLRSRFWYRRMLVCVRLPAACLSCNNWVPERPQLACRKQQLARMIKRLVLLHIIAWSSLAGNAHTGWKQRLLYPNNKIVGLCRPPDLHRTPTLTAQQLICVHRPPSAPINGCLVWH